MVYAYSVMSEHSPTRPLGAPTKWRVTPAQKEQLMAAFAQEAYPSPAQKAALASQLGVTGTQISKWFQHRRESLTRLGQFKAQYNRSRRTEQELEVLQKAFDENSYPSAERLAQLEQQLENVTSKQIKLWFKHRRKQSRIRSAAAAAAANQAAGTAIPGSSSASPDAAGNSDAVRAAAAVLTQTSAAPATPAAAVFPPFSALELMALRGALCMSKSTPSQHGLQALSTFLGRPIEHLRTFFDTELSGNYFWSFLAGAEQMAWAAAPAQIGAAPAPSIAGVTGVGGASVPYNTVPNMECVVPIAAVSPPTAPTTPSLASNVAAAAASASGSGPGSKSSPSTAASPSLPQVGAMSPFSKWSASFHLMQQGPPVPTLPVTPVPKGPPLPPGSTQTLKSIESPMFLGPQNFTSPLLKLPTTDAATPVVATPSFQPVFYLPTPPTNTHTQSTFNNNSNRNNNNANSVTVTTAAAADTTRK